MDRKDMLGENTLDFSMTFGMSLDLFPFPKGGLNEMS